MADRIVIEERINNMTNLLHRELDEMTSELAKATPQQLEEAKAAIKANPEMVAKVKAYGVDLDTIL